MARRRGTAGKKKAKGSRKSASTKRSVKRSATRAAAPKRKAAGGGTRKAARRPAKRAAAKARKPARKPAPSSARSRVRLARKRTAARASAETRRPQPARLNRERRRLEENVPTPPSSLDMNRHGSAARTGRAEIAERRQDFASLTPAITGGDVDVNVENAYFTGDEAPGGDNPTPDQDVVDDIGRAIGIEYQDNEELRASDKVTDRDRHRWELDPASSEDYKDRK
jgi:hypothetical protein